MSEKAKDPRVGKVSVGISSEVTCRDFIPPTRFEYESPLEYFAKVVSHFNHWASNAIEVQVSLQETVGDQSGEIQTLPKSEGD